jgi:thiol-disulfide isomerase/thioredoxin
MLRDLIESSTISKAGRIRVLYHVVSVAFAITWCDPLAGAEPNAPAAGPAPRAVLHLANGGFTPGELVSSKEPNRVRWQAESFVNAFDFSLGAVTAIHFPVPTELPKPVGDYCFELAGGDVLFGSLESLDETGSELEVPRIGRLRVERSSVQRIYRWRASGDLVYLGPNGLVGWREMSPKSGWREEQGQPWTDQEGAAICGDFKLPSRASIEFEISWKNKPDFVFGLGVSDDEKTLGRAFRFEVWERDLIIQRETEQEADVASVGEIAPGPGRIHRIAYLDQEKGRILVFSVDGKPLADLKVAGRQAQALGSVYLANKRGDLRLERLRIGRWNGEPPRQVETQRSRIHRVDGSILYGQIKRFERTSRAFVLASANGESRIPENQIAGIFLSLPVVAAGRSLAVVYQDGSRLSGSLEHIEKNRVSLVVPGINGSLALPLEGLRSLVSLGPLENSSAIGGIPGVLELQGTRLPGRLLDGRDSDRASCLVWLPQGSKDPSPVRQGVSGRIVYRELAPRRPVARPAPPPPPQGAGGFVVGFLSALGGAQPSQAALRRRSLYLRSGDVIPSEITSIDEKGVFFRTSLSASTFVAHDKVKAVELAQQGDASIKINKPKRERLLVLPRMQRDNPPTHLVRSRTGDFLRGRLIGMDDKTLQIEMRLEKKEIPRDRLALVVWLHPEVNDASKKPEVSAGLGTVTRVQAVCNDGIRLTFRPEQLAGDVLSGHSEVLGPCQVRLREVDQLLIGDGIDKAAAQLVYQQWMLQNAPEPKAAQDDSGDSSTGRTPGTESLLVGKPAPDFELELLGGTKFRMAQNKGRIIILDFWATWCGPCLQAMPQVEQVAREFRDRNVRLVAVNLQEEAKQISAMLERHKLGPEVALDRDGSVAEKYQANAIPQTVVIDREGTIVRLFVGGGAHLGDQLREALGTVVKEGAAKAGRSPK